MYEGAIQDLIDELGRLPGIGPKSAQRIAFHIIQSERQHARAEPRAECPLEELSSLMARS